MTNDKDEYYIDSSDEEDVINTIGNVPSEWYEKEEHIGYDRSGRKILKPSSSNKGEIDSFLDTFDNKDKHRIVKDPNTGQDVYLSDGDVMLIKSLCNSRGFLKSLDDDFVSDWFTREKMETPISAHPPQKSSFIPSLSDKKKVSLIVHAIKTGRMKMPTPIDKESVMESRIDDLHLDLVPDVWSKDYGRWELKHVPKQYLEWLPPHLLPNYKTNYARDREIIRAPKMPFPGNELSYRPPPEYLLSDKEKKEFIKNFYDKSLNSCKHIDEKPIIPRQYPNLRSVPFSAQIFIDVEKRLKDLVHAPRIKKEKVNSSTAKMLEQSLPDEKTIRPYPNSVDAQLYNNDEVVLGISISCCGRFVATVGYSKMKIWSTDLMLVKRSYNLKNDDEDKSLRNPSVAWNPNNHLLAIASGNTVKIIDPCLDADEGMDQYVRDWHKQSMKALDEPADEEPALKKVKTEITWSLLPAVARPRMEKQSSGLEIFLDAPVLEMSWRADGDYLHTLTGQGKATNSGGVLRLHKLSQCASIRPFKGEHKWRMARFNAVKSIPHMYLANTTEQTIDIYDINQQKLIKRLQVPGTASAMVVHPSGDHVAVGTFEGKLYWFDLDMGITPFKTLNINRNSIRSITLHPRYPLMSCATANGSVVVIYAKVHESLDNKPAVHPIDLFDKLDTKGDMYANVFHPIDPTMVCAGADTFVRWIRSCH